MTNTHGTHPRTRPMDDAWRMPASIDPSRLVADIALAVVGIGIGVWLIPRQLRRIRQFGGRPLARVVMIGSIVVLVVALQPDLVSAEGSLVLLLLAVLFAFRPQDVVRLTGGPRPEWAALAEGTALRRLVAARSDRGAARRLPEVRAGLARLSSVESPATARYIELVRSTLFVDPDGPDMSERLAALAVEEERLRTVVGPRPAFEGGLVAVEEQPTSPSREARAASSSEEPASSGHEAPITPAEPPLE